MESQGFDSWAIIELFGHQKIAGRVREETLGGCSFLRVDVPECGGQEAFTKYFGNSAIYSMTPTSEAVARAALKQIRPEPVNVWIPEIHQLPASRSEAPRCPGCDHTLHSPDSCDHCSWPEVIDNECPY